MSGQTPESSDSVDPGAPDPAAAPAPAVIVLAAGGGTRMKSATSKLLHELAGHALLSYALAAATQIQPQEIVVVVGHQRDQVQAHLAEIAPHVRTAVQEEQLGTGHAVQCGLTRPVRPAPAAARDRRHVRRRPHADRRDAARPGRRPPVPARRRHRADRGGGGPDRLRARRPGRRRRRHGHRRAPRCRRRDPGHHRDQLRHLRLRLRGADRRSRRPDHRQRPGRALPDRRADVRAVDRRHGRRPPDRRRRGRPRASTTGSSCRP